MNKQSKIDIKQVEGYTHVFLDGKKIDGIRGFKLEQYADNTPILTLHIQAFDATVNRECIAKLDNSPCQFDVKFDYIDADETK